MTDTQLTQFDVRARALLDSVSAAMKARYGGRLTETTRFGDRSRAFGIDRLEDVDGEPRYDFHYSVLVKRWGRGYTGVLQIEYGDFGKRQFGRTTKDGEYDINRVVEHCEARIAAQRHNRTVTASIDRERAAAQALLDAAGIGPAWESGVEVTSSGGLSVKFSLPNTVPADDLKDLLARVAALKERAAPDT